MTIIRRGALTPPDPDTYTIRRAFIADTRLSPAAKLIGLLVANEVGAFNVNDLVAHLQLTRSAVKMGLTHLEVHGYAARQADGTLVLNEALGGGR
ncbi:hypothetical protein [Microbispora sp. NPDC049125]|uniref:hypothetical protein n=1 Tax=Microbispora sp. NPDC049125 TaxID=3154929 RepID=UPI0034670F88